MVCWAAAGREDTARRQQVLQIPEATLRWLAGTLLMIDDELGAANMLPLIPFAVMSRAKKPSTGSRRAAASGR